jgi:hypothetical protein
MYTINILRERSDSHRLQPGAADVNEGNRLNGSNILDSYRNWC